MSGGFSDLVLDIGKTAVGRDTKVADVIAFVESPWGLGGGDTPIRLFPVQRVMLKAHYGLELDDTEEFELSDWRRSNFRKFTEASYLKYLFEEGRSNIKEVIPGYERREMVLSVGRRSGKTTIAAIIAAYETYKLILKGHPQGYYGLPSTNQIQIISVATDKEQAGLLYQEVSGHFRNCGYFGPYTANNTLSYARFQTPKDIERYGRYADDPTAKATLRVTFRSCIAKGLRGAGNLVVILDEAAHFTEDGQSSAENVYNAVTPSTSAFSPKDPLDSRKPIGPVEGRIISISSPLGRQGQFYKLFQIGMKGGIAASNMLCIQAPTWEVNPTIPASEFEKHYMKDPVVFFTEYGGEFTDRTRGWIEREDVLTQCIEPSARPVTAGISRQAHYVGIDVGLAGDGSAIAIGHIDREDRIVLDYLGHIKAGEGRYSDLDRLDFDGVADWVQDFGRRFYLAEGMFDHWAGIPFEQALHKRGFRQLKSVQQTAPKISDMFRNFKDMLYDGRLVFYNWPLESGQRFCDYIQELLELQAEVRSRYITDVHAPKVEGKHDDRSDALVRMVWLASQHLTKPKYICRRLPNIIPSTTNVNMTPATRPEPGAMRRMFMRARQKGSSPDRQSSRSSPNRILRRK